MGVKGLQSFFSQNEILFKSHKLHDTSVVIDGNNLIHELYFTYNVPRQNAGDYDKFATLIENYFSCYISCNIKPIVVFDGGFDTSDRKLNTVVERLDQRLRSAISVAQTHSSARVLPILAFQVAIQVFTEMNISFAQCEFEADSQLAALANSYKCPVVSNDSDFYLLDVQHGFIRIDSIEPSVICKQNASGQIFNFLSCQIYNIDRFVSYFPGIDKNVLPLVGILIGNDFVEPDMLNGFFSSMRLPNFNGNKIKAHSNQKAILKVICWLQHQTLTSAIEQILAPLKKKPKKLIRNIINQTIDDCKIVHCNVMFVIDGRLNKLQAKFIGKNLVTSCGQALPLSFMKQFLSGHFPPFFLNVITLHRAMLSTQIEKASLESSYACSSHIRKILYGILLSHVASDSSPCRSKNCLQDIDEYDRIGRKLYIVKVEPTFSIDEIELPKLTDLENISKEYGKCITLKALSCDVSNLHEIPHELQLLVAVINYWVKNATPAPCKELVLAIILNIIYYVALEMVKATRSNKSIKKQSNVTAFKGLNISASAAKNMQKQLRKYSAGSMFNIQVIHSYSQLQTCILCTIFLNKLLGSPFSSTACNYFNGTMLSKLTEAIKSQPNLDLFISKMFDHDAAFYGLFLKLNDRILTGDNLVKKFIPRDKFVQKASHNRQKRR